MKLRLPSNLGYHSPLPRTPFVASVRLADNPFPTQVMPDKRGDTEWHCGRRRSICKRITVPLLLFPKTEHFSLEVKGNLPQPECRHAHNSTEIPAAGLLPWNHEHSHQPQVS